MPQLIDLLTKIPFEPAPLQKQDAETAARTDRMGLFYDVGGGKTVVSTLTALMWDDDTTLILCPPILLVPWQEWLHEIGELDTVIFRGPKRNLDMLKHKWVIMSHAIYRIDFTEIQRFYIRKSVNVIVDEAQALKNPKSVLFRNVNSFIAPDRRILLLTATPTSKPEDTYSYMRIKTPQLYRSFGHWDNLHVDEKDIFGAIKGYKNIELLAENFGIKSITRTKKELFGDVLTPIYQPIPYELEPKHRKLYERLADEQLLLLDNGDKIDATSAQRLRHALQQIVWNYDRFSGEEGARSAGYDLLDQIIEEVDPMTKGHSKLAIWTYYKMTSAAVIKYLTERYGAQAVAGAYGDVNSEEGVRRIMKDDNCRFFVGQPGSAGAGLNLQHVCSEMFMAEMSTSVIQIKQVIGRVDRPGQKVRPTIRFSQAQGTIQLKLFKDLLKNDDLAAKVERTPKSLRDEIFGRV